jgi:hypothetical protein
MQFAVIPEKRKTFFEYGTNAYVGRILKAEWTVYKASESTGFQPNTLIENDQISLRAKDCRHGGLTLYHRSPLSS